MEAFDFDEWINNHNLNDFKQIFIDHNATTPSSLTFTSLQMQQLMADERLPRQNILSIMNAVQNIAQSVKKEVIVISEQEQQVIDQTKANIKSWNELETELNQVMQKYRGSAQRLNEMKLAQISIVKRKIDEQFEKITKDWKHRNVKPNHYNALNQRKQELMTTLNEFLNQSDEKDINDEKGNEFDLVQVNIAGILQFLKKKENECNGLISTNKDREDRRSKILTVGKKVEEQYNKARNNLISNMAQIEETIKDNNKQQLNVDCLFNEIEDTNYNMYVIDYYNNQDNAKMISRIGTIIHKQAKDMIKIDFKWAAEKPPKTSEFLWRITNNGKTAEKQVNSMQMIRLDPWLSKENYRNKIMTVLIRLDLGIGGGAIGQIDAIGVITKEYWNNEYAVNCFKCQQKDHMKGCHRWCFKDSQSGCVIVGINDVQHRLMGTPCKNDVMKIEINFRYNAITYTLHRSGKMNAIESAYTGKFEPLENEEVCIAIGQMWAVEHGLGKFTIL